MKQRWIIAGAFVAAVAVVLLLDTRRRQAPPRDGVGVPATTSDPGASRRSSNQVQDALPASGQPSSRQPVTPLSSRSTLIAQSAAAPAPPPPPVFPDAAVISDTAVPPRIRLGAVARVLEEYRRRFGAYPTGEDNAAIVRALVGRNPGSLPFLSDGAPATNSRGELIDPWQTPYFFHLLSRDHIEIRSAGADTIMWNDDDLLVSAPASKPDLTQR